MSVPKNYVILGTAQGLLDDLALKAATWLCGEVKRAWDKRSKAYRETDRARRQRRLY
jgi:hypothetical protein